MSILTNQHVDSGLVRLRQMHSGQIGKVVSMTGSPQEIARVSAMGLRTGAVISVSRGGITCIVQFENGNRLCLRASRDLDVLVKPL